jgi:hypothetical protein
LFAFDDWIRQLKFKVMSANLNIRSSVMADTVPELDEEDKKGPRFLRTVNWVSQED